MRKPKKDKNLTNRKEEGNLYKKILKDNLMQILLPAKPLCFLIFISIFFPNCSPYKSEFPISKPANNLNIDSLKGSWIVLYEKEESAHPLAELNFRNFNQNEYLCLMTVFRKKGRGIDFVSPYRVLPTKVSEDLWFSSQRLKENENAFVFSKIEQLFEDSIHVRYLTDSLKMSFEDSQSLHSFLEEVSDSVEEKFLSPPVALYRWKALKWNLIQKNYQIENFEYIYTFGRREEENFEQFTKEDLIPLIREKESKLINPVKQHFQKIHLTEYGHKFWKVSEFAVIEFKNGDLLKIKFDRHTRIIHDLTNDLYFYDDNIDRLYRLWNKY